MHSTQNHDDDDSEIIAVVTMLYDHHCPKQIVVRNKETGELTQRALYILN